ncbi:MAG: FAD-dependent oxidoreductase [Cryobacterium sp.]|nr:FAD-dependent oxidoreductase [Oligoflexia bacterium]
MLFPPLKKNLRVDAVVVGGGIAGLTSALRLTRAGKRVAVIDQGEVASGESSHSTAHLTEFLDTPYTQLVHDLSMEDARILSEAKRNAIRSIKESSREILLELKIDAEFKSMPAYTYGETDAELDELRTELSSLWDIGMVGYWCDDIPLAGPALGGIELPNQATVHPRKYLLGLVELLERKGCLFFENTRATEVIGGVPSKVVTPGGTILADDVIMATHVPTSNQTFLQTKVAAYRTYAMVLKLWNSPPEALYFDRRDPYHYLRPWGEFWILGGEDHKTGTEEHAASHFLALETFARRNLGVEKVIGQWSGQILEPADGLPYIGHAPGEPHVYLATGFSGCGMTFGTLAGDIISDLIAGETNGAERLLRPNRMGNFHSLACYLSENSDFPKFFVKDRIHDAEVESVDEIACGEGKRVRIDDRVLAVYRDDETKLHAVSAVCPHAGCHVHFNDAEKTWDCPCHGSRFETTGKLLNGPAMENLKRESLARRDPPMTLPLSEAFGNPFVVHFPDPT